ncbi:MAG TPA: M23 family metallopeptidase [Vitreimonas sp.]|uniref:murein hydrolase activator EnvC family protein n=1 Tax=Vitreimonas sp. TaxID=3069702 RepID=UPI002D66DF86|nr:M23 family metallopeptidase [Vitreimonas sp.]HYD89345.1 M23 family metallopeptidase [Vitreimonas sp.]
MQRTILAAAIMFAVSAGAADAEQFSAPVVAQQAHISSAFGPREAGSFHSGVDIAAAAGSEVRSPAGGEVIAVHAPGALAGYRGQVVEIDHSAEGRTRFSNLEAVTLAAGARIEAGDVIGRIAANDAPHVHVELWRGGRLFDPAQAIMLIAAR